MAPALLEENVTQPVPSSPLAAVKRAAHLPLREDAKRAELQRCLRAVTSIKLGEKGWPFKR